MPHYYVVDTVGAGTKRNPHRAREFSHSAIHLRRRGQAAADARWIVALDGPFTHPNARLLGVDKGDDPGVANRAAMKADLGYQRDLVQTRVDELIYDLLIDPPETNGWNPLKSSRAPGGGREFAVYLGGAKLITRPAIMGGATYDDDYNRTNETPVGGDWISGEGSLGDMNLVSNHLEGALSGSDNAAWVDSAVVDFGDDHYAEVNVVWSGSGSREGSPNCRCGATTGDSGYWGAASAGGSFIIYDSSANQLATGGSPSSGDLVRLNVSGSNLELFQNGSSVLTVTNTTHTTGQPGVGVYRGSSATVEVDNFAASDEAGTSVIPVMLASYRRRHQLGMG